MRILVTGTQGLLGGALASALATQGHAVVATGRRPGAPAKQGLVYRPAELADAGDVRALFDEASPDAVVHAAARIRGGDDAAFARDNLTATAHLADAAAPAAVRTCIFFSTISVYSGDGPFTEASPASAEDPYGRTKRAAEQVWLQRATGDALVLRLAGLHGRPRHDGFVHDVAALARRGAAIELAEPETRVTLTFIDDVIATVSHVLGTPRAPDRRLFNLATAESPTYRELAESLRALLGSNSPIVTPPAPRRRNRVLDTARLRAGLNPPLISLADHLRQAAALAAATGDGP